MMSLPAMSLGFVPAERAGQGEVDGCTKRVQTACLPLDLAVASPWSALGSPPLHKWAQKTVILEGI